MSDWRGGDGRRDRAPRPPVRSSSTGTRTPRRGTDCSGPPRRPKAQAPVSPRTSGGVVPSPLEEALDLLGGIEDLVDRALLLRVGRFLPGRPRLPAFLPAHVSLLLR